MGLWSLGVLALEHISYTNSNRYQATYRLTNVGDYIFHASCNGNPCHAGTIGFTLDFIPDFWIEKKCDSIVIHNNSKYLDDSKLVYITINSNTIQFPVSQPEYSYHTASGSYTIALTGYDTPNSISNCIIDNITISNVPNATVSITSPWGDKTCDNTAMELEVTLVPNIPYQYISWDFGDGSSLQTTNNLVSHTYKQGDYNLTVSVVNMDGCSLPATIEIESLQDNLKQGDIVEENNIEVDITTHSVDEVVATDSEAVTITRDVPDSEVRTCGLQTGSNSQATAVDGMHAVSIHIVWHTA